MKLVVENLVVSRGDREVIKGRSFSAKSGDALTLTGRNGSGKTTLLRAVAGLIQPDAGEITLSGAGEDGEVSDYCHYVGHLNGVKASQTVSETVLFFAQFLNPDASRTQHLEAVDEALAQFALSELASVPSGYLSAGQRRRLGLARLLSAPRPIWLLDEPTTSLDQISSNALGKIIDAHVSGGGLVIAATHLDLGLANSQTLSLDPEVAA